MASFVSLPVEVREIIINKLSNQDLLRVRQVCQELFVLACHILNRRHLQLWSWTPHFNHYDEDDWVHSKMAKGVICGGTPFCCCRHNLEKVHLPVIFSKSMVIWIEDKASEKLNRVIAPLLYKHGSLLTSFTLTLDECAPKSILITDITALLSNLPNLRNFGFRVCNCSICPKEHSYATRRSQLPSLPHLEVLDFEYNESIVFTDTLLKAYGKQIKRLTVPAILLEGSNYLCDSVSIFDELRDLKITSIHGEYQRRLSVISPRVKFTGKKLFKMLASLSVPWRLERLSLNIDDWAVHRADRWTIAILELLQLLEKSSSSLKELYIYFELVDRSMNFSDWMSSSGIHIEEQDHSTSRYLPPKCPLLRKVSVDSVLMETPLLLHILESFGNVEHLEFFNWCHYDSRWSGRYELANIPGNARPIASDLPKMVERFWKGLHKLRSICVFGTKEGDSYYKCERRVGLTWQ